MTEQVLFRGEKATVIEHREARSVKGARFLIAVIKTARRDRICVLPRELQRVGQEGARSE